MRRFVFILSIIAMVACNLDFLHYMPNCSRDDYGYNNCLMQYFNAMRQYTKNGVKEIELPSINPLVLKKVNINHTSQDATVTATLHNLTFYNLYDFEVVNVQSAEGKLTVKALLDSLPFETYYKMSGTLFNNGLVGEGRAIAIFKEVEAIIIYTTRNINDIEFCNDFNVDLQMNGKELYLIATGLSESVYQMLSLHLIQKKLPQLEVSYMER
ncbi:hypothetical protein FQA39_LY18830 [Lamprigera yunnana]|nr:hypothetical protein FQA39_LY18830 [Lamprigera yunnana]